MKILKEQFKKLKAETQVAEYILNKYPDAIQSEIEDYFFKNDCLIFTTCSNLYITDVLVCTHTDTPYFWTAGIEVIDMNQFDYPEVLKEQYQRIAVMYPGQIWAHKSAKQGYMVDNTSLSDTRFVFSSTDLKDRILAGVKSQLIDWILRKSKATSFKGLEPETCNLPIDIVNGLKDHFILK